MFKIKSLRIVITNASISMYSFVSHRLEKSQAAYPESVVHSESEKPPPDIAFGMMNVSNCNYMGVYLAIRPLQLPRRTSDVKCCGRSFPADVFLLIVGIAAGLYDGSIHTYIGCIPPA